jgi:catechol 2,3-dioxygenase-like lactoylglutathione lyase family enzyme
MRLGNCSISLAVKDIAKSRAFYEKLGFRVFGGDQAKNWLILQNETATIGLFQGMFDKNTMTFNPGWDRSGKSLPDFDDVRDIQKTIKNRGLALRTEADETTTGPASLMLLDPDGNPVLIDQHVSKPQNLHLSGWPRVEGIRIHRRLLSAIDSALRIEHS